MNLPVGSTIPIAIQLIDNATDKYIRAHVRDNDDNEISGSPVNLTHISNGLYTNYDLIFPEVPFVTVQYIVYDDSGYTIISESEGSGLDAFMKSIQSSSSGNSEADSEAINDSSETFVEHELSENFAETDENEENI